MRITSRKTALSGLALAGVSSLLLAGCAAAPEAPSDGPKTPDFLPCMVSDTGGFDDNSFNEIGKQGLPWHLIDVKKSDQKELFKVKT